MDGSDKDEVALGDATSGLGLDEKKPMHGMHRNWCRLRSNGACTAMVTQPQPGETGAAYCGQFPVGVFPSCTLAVGVGGMCVCGSRGM